MGRTTRLQHRKWALVVISRLVILQGIPVSMAEFCLFLFWQLAAHTMGCYDEQVLEDKRGPGEGNP